MRVSVVTVSLNQLQFIRENVSSVQSQSYPLIEQIIVDGASTDGTREFLETLQPDSVRWVSEPDGGQSEALNKGFRMARGDIIGWINSDDVLLPGAVEKVVEAFERHPEAVAVTGAIDIVDAEGHLLRNYPAHEYTADYLLNESYGINQASTFFTRKALFEAGLIDESLHYSMDFDLFIKLAKIGPFVAIDDRLAAFRLYEGTKTSESQGRFAAERMRIRRSYGGRLFSKAGRNDLYVRFTQPLKKSPFLVRLVRGLRGNKGV